MLLFHWSCSDGGEHAYQSLSVYILISRPSPGKTDPPDWPDSSPDMIYIIIYIYLVHITLYYLVVRREQRSCALWVLYPYYSAFQFGAKNDSRLSHGIPDIPEKTWNRPSYKPIKTFMFPMKIDDFPKCQVAISHPASWRPSLAMAARRLPSPTRSSGSLVDKTRVLWDQPTWISMKL